MKAARFVAIAFLYIFVIASPALAVDTTADKLPDVEDALKQWKAALEDRRLDVLMKLYDHRAIMISTFVQQPIVRHSEIALYYKKVIANPDIQVDIQTTNPRVYGTMAINTGTYTLSYSQEGEKISIPARFSFVYELERNKWVIVDHHSSRVPLPEEKK